MRSIPSTYRSATMGTTLSDSEILAIGKNYSGLVPSAGTIKNRFEILKLIKKWFESADGVSVLLFLEPLPRNVVRLQAEQKERHYKPRSQ